MATSKKGPLYPSRDRATRMAPNLKPSSSETSSSGYGARRARSVPSSPDRKLGPSAAAAAPSASPDMCRPSLSHAGRSISSRTMSGSGPSIHGSKPASKPALARAKSDKVTANSQRPHALAGPLSSSFKDTANSSSTLLKNKLSPRPTPSKGVASPKPSIQRASSPSPSPGALRGGKPLPASSARAPGTAAKKREAAANGGANAISRPRGAPQKAVEPSTTSRKEKDDEPSMQFEESESLTTPSIEDQLQEQLPDPVDLKPIDMAASASASASPRRDQQGPHTQQQGKNEQPEKEGADAGGKNNKPDIAKVADELDREAETEEAITKASSRAEAAQSWRKDDPKSNDVIEEAKSKLLEERQSRVKALVGAFETVMSFKE
ncbi:hypothetical protein CFC21_023482 [Triticum aestivum]|uniref:Calmodulin-binding domain-containing protein n=2 Tax=Triticum aestivum TaxID=4565 RepID=A0A9R1J9L8_WHEAT|nr:nucleolar and coiled-body phosphoprotein 1-like [Triticum aestivum]XP_044324075.1 nucleolar and coiled-body phosphoprotein 1-like [Triticum aestivum]KAF7008797.1 hypothetical protein CFC21_023482 [Triticum aestivum]